MKKTKIIKNTFIGAALMCSAMMLGACGENSENSETGDIDYKVTVQDGLGNTYGSGIIVQFYKGEEQVAMQACDENGVAAKTLEAGDYTVQLKFTGDESGYYYEQGLSVSAKNPELEVNLSYAINSEPKSLYASGVEYNAYDLSTGCTYLELDTEDRNYFLFTPTEAGNYEFSIIDGASVEIGYYGTPFFVLSDSIAEAEDNRFNVSISAGMIGTEDTGTTVLVLGIDAVDSNTCVLGINRVGDPEQDLDDIPWDVYEKTSELSAYTLPEGTEILEFDLTADGYNLVYNETDGFYHLDSEDGPLVLVRLTEDSSYMTSFMTVMEASAVRRYFFDDNGEFVKKESYSECLLEYIECADETYGVYPLTEDLKYIIQQYGDYNGWWDTDSYGYLFVNSSGLPIAGINNDIAWLFMCCYINQ